MELFTLTVSGDGWDESYDVVVGVYDSLEKAEEQAKTEMTGSKDLSDVSMIQISKITLNTRDFGKPIKTWDNYDGNGFQLSWDGTERN